MRTRETVRLLKKLIAEEREASNNLLRAELVYKQSIKAFTTLYDKDPKKYTNAYRIIYDNI